METRYFGRSKQPHYYKECKQCGFDGWMLASSDYCSTECMGKARTGDRNPAYYAPHFHGTVREYKKFHARVYRARGRANHCKNGCVAKRYSWANLTGHYEDVQDYEQMCTKCHSAYDRKRSVDETVSKLSV